VTPAATARHVALAALERIEGGAYANLVLGPLLDRAALPERDRHLVTELVYGATRMRRACDWLYEQFLRAPVEPLVRNVLRLGTYQLAYLDIPPHAAVSATVDLAPRRASGLVNAVLRRVSQSLPPAWPDEATELSYPDWIVNRLTEDLGHERAREALRAMNRPGRPHRRADGYVQDLASQWVAEAVEAGPGLRVADVCAGPGGKATFMAGAGATVVAGDVQPHRAGLVAANASRVDVAGVSVVVADGRTFPAPPGSFDRVLVDAPCSGLGVLGRRPDARWRITDRDVEDLALLQRQLIATAAELVGPGGLLVYSACTLTRTETVEQGTWVTEACPDLEPLEPPGPPWDPAAPGAVLLPQAAGTDGMYLLRLRKP
jgi:16S rRNA (cytosine967-C5)-methyltransferase